MDSLTPNDLWKSVSRMNVDGIRRTTKVRDVLIHVITEELHHRGEIIAILWQMNFQPPDMGWLSVMKKTDPIWVLKREKKRSVENHKIRSFKFSNDGLMRIITYDADSNDKIIGKKSPLSFYD